MNPQSTTNKPGNQPRVGHGTLTPSSALPDKVERKPARDSAAGAVSTQDDAADVAGSIHSTTETTESASDSVSTDDHADSAPQARGRRKSASGSAPAPAVHLEVLTQDPVSPDSSDHAPLPDLLFVHGAWHGAWCWARMQAYSALAGFRSHAVNLRGHGDSSGRELLARLHLDEYVADVAHVARALDRPFVLLGHSMGGTVCQRYLSLLEQGRDIPAPAGVVLLATTLPPDMANGLRRRALVKQLGGPIAMLRALLTMYLTGDVTAFVSSPELVRALFFTPVTPEQDVIDCFIRLQNESATVIRESQRLGRIWQTPLRATPMLVLGGAQDACFTPATLRRLAAAYGSTLHLFAGMGHDLMLDQGWEQVTEAIIGWVRGLPATSETPAPPATPRRGAQIIPLRSLLESSASPIRPVIDDAYNVAGDGSGAQNGRPRAS